MNSNAQESNSTALPTTTRTPIRDLPHAKDVASRIVSDHTRADALLMQAIAVPPEHDWQSNDGLAGEVLSTPFGHSLYIRKIPQSGLTGNELTSDPAQIHVEIRIFTPECEYRDGLKRKHFRRFSGNRYSGHLWVRSGPQWAVRYRTHLVDQEPFVYADTIEELCAAAAAMVTVGLARAQQALEGHVQSAALAAA